MTGAFIGGQTAGHVLEDVAGMFSDEGLRRSKGGTSLMI